MRFLARMFLARLSPMLQGADWQQDLLACEAAIQPPPRPKSSEAATRSWLDRAHDLGMQPRPFKNREDDSETYAGAQQGILTENDVGHHE